jgi:hypothetical protein
MMYSTYMLLAMDLANEGARAADRARQRREALAARATTHRSLVRTPAARLLATFSRGSAAVARRLDECVADDLGRSLSPTE